MLLPCRVALNVERSVQLLSESLSLKIGDKFLVTSHESLILKNANLPKAGIRNAVRRVG